MTPALIFGWLPVIGVTGRDVPIITLYALLFVFFAVSFLLGWARAGRPWLQVGFVLFVCGLYAAYLVAGGAWASQCWDCTDGSGEDGRGMGYMIGAVYLGAYTVCCVIGLALGLIASATIRRPAEKARA